MPRTLVAAANRLEYRKMKSFIQYSTEKKNELDEDITWMLGLLSWGMVAYIWFNDFSRVQGVLANKDYPENQAELKHKNDNL